MNLLRQQRCAATRQSYARILLKADEAGPEGGRPNADSAAAVEGSIATLARVRRCFVEHGLEFALARNAPDREYERRLDGAAEARLSAVACGAPPEGRARWTLRLLAGRLVELEVVASVGPETVRPPLLANELKPWLKRTGCIAPTASADVVCRLEAVLAVYQRPLDLKRPVVCLDETTKQLVSETRTPLSAAGRPVREDYEYERQGVASRFMLGAPLSGGRAVSVRERKTRGD